MNKTQIILAAVGGTTVVGALVLGYFIWDASSSKTEHAEALDGNISSASSVMKKLPMKPVVAGLQAYRDNCEAYGEWQAEAKKVASRGDLVFDKVTPAEFKTTIVGEARKIADLPGCFNGKFVKPDFGFGFKDYVTGGALPPEADLKRLQREWNDVSSVLKTIAECGGADAGIVDVRMGAEKAKAQVEEESASKKKGKKAKKAKVKEVAKEGAGAGPAVTAFTVDFMTRPSGLVKAVNAFATGTRFIVVENCTFVRERDELAENLGGDSKKTERAGSGRRRPQMQEKKDAAKGGVVTDPATAPLMKVTMAISVYDFRSLEEETKAKEEEKEAK